MLKFYDSSHKYLRMVEKSRKKEKLNTKKRQRNNREGCQYRLGRAAPPCETQVKTSYDLIDILCAVTHHCEELVDQDLLSACLHLSPHDVPELSPRLHHFAPWPQRVAVSKRVEALLQEKKSH